MQKNKVNQLLGEMLNDVKLEKVESFLMYRDAILIEMDAACDAARKDGFRDALFALKKEWEKMAGE